MLTVNVPRCAYEVIQTSILEAIVELDKNDNYLSHWKGNSFNAVGVGCGLSVSVESGGYMMGILSDGVIENLLIDADGLDFIS